MACAGSLNLLSLDQVIGELATSYRQRSKIFESSSVGNNIHLCVRDRAEL